MQSSRRRCCFGAARPGADVLADVRSPALRYVLISAVVLGAGVLGGVTNHIRGGWLNVKTVPDRETLLNRWNTQLIFAAPQGVLLWLLTGDWWLALCLIANAWATLYVGWGSYFALGTEAASAMPRAGVFDRVVGYPCAHWTDLQRLLRDVTGMTLRGLLASVPIGVQLWTRGFGWLYAFSGSGMGVAYAIGWHVSTAWDFGRGIPNSEFIWGAFAYMALCVAVFARAAVPPRATTRLCTALCESRTGCCCAPSRADLIASDTAHSGGACGKRCGGCLRRRATDRCGDWTGAVLALAVWVLNAVCLAWYVQITQSDMTNMHQSVFGMSWSVGWAALVLVVGALYRSCCPGCCNAGDEDQRAGTGAVGGGGGVPRAVGDRDGFASAQGGGAGIGYGARGSAADNEPRPTASFGTPGGSRSANRGLPPAGGASALHQPFMSDGDDGDGDTGGGGSGERDGDGDGDDYVWDDTLDDDVSLASGRAVDRRPGACARHVIGYDGCVSALYVVIGWSVRIAVWSFAALLVPALVWTAILTAGDSCSAPE